jgi:hypothetical protein
MLDLEDIADVVASAVREATAPLLARINALESRDLALPGKGEQGERGEKGEPGEVDMAAVKALIDDAVAALPQAEKGEAGSPGRDCDMAEVANLVQNAVKSAVEALPAPRDGEAGKDGLGLANALIDRDGVLVLTMTDGTSKLLGRVVGIDGAPGKDAEPFTLDDFDIEAIDERSIRLKFTHGSEAHSFDLEFPLPIYRGVFVEDAQYQRGDVVTWAGSAWHCDEAKSLKPGAADSGWRLMVKAGRPGKDAGK